MSTTTHLMTLMRQRWALGVLLICAWALMGAATAPKNWWIDLKNDRASQIQDSLRRGMDPNVVNERGMPALMQAVRDEAWDSFDILLAQRKIDVNVTNAMDETPLMYVAVVGDTQRASRLIAKGAQVNRLGWTPLHYAASRGHVDTVRLLLKQKAIVNAPGPDGTTPLMMAAYGGSEDVIRVLLAAGADITTRNLQNQTAVEWARLKNHDSLAGKLEDLTQRALDQRAALREEARRAAAGEPAQAATVQNPPEADAKATAAPSQSDPKAGQADSGNGSSGYFDLQRFEREDGEQW